MSVRINVKNIARLLLQDGVWYEVLPGSVTVDVYEWTDGEGGPVVEGKDVVGVPVIGVRFKVQGRTGWISCPLKSIVAVHDEPINIEDPIALNIPDVLTDDLDTKV